MRKPFLELNVVLNFSRCSESRIVEVWDKLVLPDSGIPKRFQMRATVAVELEVMMASYDLGFVW